jgi:sugar lactone lactonase YvrE
MKQTLRAFMITWMLLSIFAVSALAANQTAVATDGAFSSLIRTDDGLLVTDVFNKVVWQVTDEGKEIYAGKIGVSDLSGEPLGGYYDGTVKTAQFASPWAITPFMDGYALTDPLNNVIRYISNNKVLTIAGSGKVGESNARGVNATFDYPTGLATDDAGNLYIADTGNNVIRKVTEKGDVTTYADGFLEPTGLCWYDGVLYVADSGHNRICKVENGVVSTIAGGVEDQVPSEGVFEGDYIDGSITKAKFSYPQGVALASNGAIYVADTGNGAVRKIENGQVSTFLFPAKGDKELFPVAPRGLMVEGNLLYVCDTFASVINVVSLEEKAVSYLDVPKDSWFYDAVTETTRMGILQGTGSQYFEPLAEIDRAMFVTMLSRAFQSTYPTIIITGDTAFSDVPADSWYHDAVAWAAEQTIAKGFGNDQFDPTRSVSRQEMVCFLYRYAKLLEMDRVVSDETLLDGFSDAKDLSSWAIDAMTWAVDRGILKGNESGLLEPLANTTRAEAAQMMKNFVGAVGEGSL